MLEIYGMCKINACEEIMRENQLIKEILKCTRRSISSDTPTHSSACTGRRYKLLTGLAVSSCVCVDGCASASRSHGGEEAHTYPVWSLQDQRRSCGAV